MDAFSQELVDGPHRRYPGAPVLHVVTAPAVPEDARSDLADVFQRSRQRLLRLAVLLVDDPATAEDVVQDVFVRVVSRGDTHIESIDDYLTAAVLNRARSALRRRMTGVRGLKALAGITALVVADPTDLVGEQIVVWRAVRGLPRRQREVLVCRYWLGLSEQQTADTLGVSVGTVKTSASRARATLTKVMGPAQ